MSIRTWLIAIYLAGGVLTSLAVVWIGWSGPSRTVSAQPRQRGRNLLFRLKVFALWPGIVIGVVGMAIVFAVIMLAQRRQ